MGLSVAWSGSDVQENNELGLKVSAESLEEPEMRMKFLTVHVFKACEHIEFYVFIIVKLIISLIIWVIGSVPFLCSILCVCVLGFPFILVEDSEKFFDVGRKIVVFGDEMFLLFSFKVVN